jgi:sugar phosphate isomerase/epimerase
MSTIVKLGAFNDDLHTDFLHAAQIAVEEGLDGLAVRNVRGRNIAELDTAEVTGIRRIADDHGIEIASIGSQFGRGLYLGDAAAQAQAEAHLARAIRYADICSTALVRGFAAWLPGQEPLTEWTRRPSFPDALSALVDALRPSVRMAEKAGVTLMFELEGASYVGTVSEAIELFAALDSPSVALCWDVCNGWWSGEEPLDGYARLGQVRVVDVQTKDVPADPEDPRRALLTRAVVGEGDVGYPDILPDLVKGGYSGYITAERVHHPVRPEDDPIAQASTLSDIRNLNRILNPVRKQS